MSIKNTICVSRQHIVCDKSQIQLIKDYHQICIPKTVVIPEVTEVHLYNICYGVLADL